MSRFEPSQAVQDLVWAITSPSLIEGSEVLAPSALDAAAIDPESLDAFVAKRWSHRVGRYFESLVEYWLAHVRRVEVLGAGLQILEADVTLGELDFVFRNELGQICHLETAVKFYLHDPAARGSHFPGPNSTDNFERKVAKLFGQQLRLSEVHRRDVEVRHALVKGRVFYHLDHEPPETLPESMSPTHERGTWIRAYELATLEDRGATLGCVVTKPHWLAPVATAGLVPVRALATMLEGHFARAGHPVMVSLRDRHNPCDEVERLFVVADRWPARPLPTSC